MREFIFKPFTDMREEDYAAVGFKSGLEIHQQLLTSKKLFCRCPAGRYTRRHDAEILRHMRPTLSELGEYDGTALMEFKTKKEIIYRINRESVCTYEMDDTPPFEINEEALDIALEIGLLYGCAMVDEIHIARKQYLDGSIPTGFQRTSIVSLDGRIPYKGREIRIVQLSIEEDSCREVSDVGHRRVYITDRLGMPLMETVTGADMRTPQEVADVANICRYLARSTGKVRSGIGAARQDVNVSVTGGTRVEIKGVPRILNIPLLTYNEAMRQWNLLRLRDELERRGITRETFEAKTEDITKILRKTLYRPICDAIDAGCIVKAVVLKGFRDLLRWQTQTDTSFSREISDRVRVIACLTTLPNIIHSDSASETIASSEWSAVKRTSGSADHDAVVVVWGDTQDAVMGANEIIIRAKEATIGIPSETRQALRDGTNGFERILPGPDRMYPDTDLPPKRITPERIEHLRSVLPEPCWIREDWYSKLGIPVDLHRPLAISPFAPLFRRAVEEYDIHPVLAAVVLIQYPKRLRRTLRQAFYFDESVFERLFRDYKSGMLVKDGFLPAMDMIARGEKNTTHVLKSCSPKEVTDTITEMKKTIETVLLRNPLKKTTVLTGMIMDRLRGRVDGAVVTRMLGSERGEG